MKTWKLVSGIFTMLFSIYATFSGIVFGIDNAINNRADGGDSAVLLINMFFFMAGLVSICVRKSKIAGNVAIIILYGITAIIGFSTGGSQGQWTVVAVWSTICAAIAAISLYNNINNSNEPINTSSSQANIATTSKQCPYCHADIPSRSIFCGFCGKELPKEKICPQCGASVDTNALFCSNCGKNLSEPIAADNVEQTVETVETVEDVEDVEYDEDEEYEESSMKKYLPYVLGAIALIAICGGVWWYFNSSKASHEAEVADSIPTDSIAAEAVEEEDASVSTKETITKRLEEIFDDVVKGNIYDHDEKFFSSDFNRIYNEVADIDSRFAEEGYLGFWDFGFWDMSQEDVKLNVTIKDVYDVKDKEAMAKIAFKFTYFDGSSHTSDEDIKVVLENGKWVLDDLHGYKKQMKAFAEEYKNYQPPTQDEIVSSFENDYSSNSSNTSSSSRTFYSEQIVIGYLANQTFRESGGLTMRVDGDGRLYVDGDYAGVLSVSRYNSTSALLRYGGGMYGEGELTVNIVGDKFTLTDPTDGTVYYQK